jgi:hypothetical protein
MNTVKEQNILDNKYLVKGLIMKKAIFKQIKSVASSSFPVLEADKNIEGLGYVASTQTTSFPLPDYFIFKDKNDKVYKFIIADSRFKANYPQIFII